MVEQHEDGWQRVANVEHTSYAIVELVLGDRRAYLGPSKVIHEWTDEPSRRLAYLLARTGLHAAEFVVPKMTNTGFLELYNKNTKRSSIVLLPQPHSFRLALQDIGRDHDRRRHEPKHEPAPTQPRADG